MILWRRIFSDTVNIAMSVMRGSPHTPLRILSSGRRPRDTTRSRPPVALVVIAILGLVPTLAAPALLADQAAIRSSSQPSDLLLSPAFLPYLKGASAVGFAGSSGRADFLIWTMREAARQQATVGRAGAEVTVPVMTRNCRFGSRRASAAIRGNRDCISHTLTACSQCNRPAGAPGSRRRIARPAGTAPPCPRSRGNRNGGQ